MNIVGAAKSVDYAVRHKLANIPPHPVDDHVREIRIEVPNF
ncbi:hypothetical protein [Pseudooceanicola batsensis]|nr:hypothetical protein [Pseudooceanicola batsensis]